MNSKGLAAFVLTGLILAGCSSPVGSQSPDILFQRYPSGSLHLNSLTASGPVLLVFWASWCPSCVEEVPEVQKLYDRYAGTKLQIYAVNAGEDKATIKEFLEKHKISYPVFLDEDGEAANKLDVSGLPTIILLAKGGEIIYYGFNLPPDLDVLLTKENQG